MTRKKIVIVFILIYIKFQFLFFISFFNIILNNMFLYDDVEMNENNNYEDINLNIFAFND
jgi:hypothetical protein